MARRTTPRRRVVTSTGEAGARRTIMAPSAGPLDELALDDRPLAIARSHDGRHLLVTLPYEIWIVDAKTLAVQRSVALTNARPSLAEGWEGALWLGGQHLFRANLATTSATKVGSKLNGYVDHVALVRDDLLACAGAQGELLWDIDRDGPIHRRKSSGPAALDLVATADGRAVVCDGSETAWVIDPSYPEGYAQLRLANTSPTAVAPAREGVVRLGRTDASLGGRVLLGARDGAVAWTARDLRLAGERIPAGAGTRDLGPLALAGDERWVYALRGRGLLQRFLIAQPRPAKPADEPANKRPGKRHAKLGAFAQQAGKPGPGDPSELDAPPLPEAQQVRLDKLASAMALLVDDDKRTLVLGGPKADGRLGRLWTVDPEALAWEELALGQRALVEPPPPADPDAEPPPAHKPSFVATKNKLAGIKLREVAVDDVVGDVTGNRVDYWLTTGAGGLLDRPVQRLPADEILPGDALLVPAMVRFAEGTARPALLVWPGVVDDHAGPAPELQWLVWGDEPRGWMPLETPEIRKQKWSRTDLFPVRVALVGVPEGVPGKRAAIDPKWIDADHFEALARECKKLLKVLW